MSLNTIGSFTVHPAANIFPLLQGKEFTDLVKDIMEKGIRDPLIFSFDDKLVDGRNRARAAKEAGIPEEDIPRKKLTKAESTEAAILERVRSENIFRRHLTSEQRAATVTDIMDKLGELARLEKETARETAENRSKHMAEVNEAKRTGVKAPKKTSKKGYGKLAETVAKRAGVSPAVARKVLATKKNDPVKFAKLATAEVDESKGRGKGPRVKWNVPKNPTALADFLITKWTPTPALMKEFIGALRLGGVIK